MATLGGMGAGGVVGGIIGALVGMGLPKYEAQRHEGMLREGGILLSVDCDNSDWVKRAKRILERTGAHDISSSGEVKADYERTDKPRVRHGGGGAELRSGPTQPPSGLEVSRLHNQSGYL